VGLLGWVLMYSPQPGSLPPSKLTASEVKRLSLRDFESVKRWFAAGQYTERTQRTYLRWLKLWCGILDLTPNELVHAEPVATQAELANIMMDDLGYKEYTTHYEMTALHQFWEANGVQLLNDVMEFKGCDKLRFRK
jgi:hypothetical protein